MMPPSPCLPTAIAEAITAHAAHYTSKAMTAETVLAALADIASGVLADIADNQIRAEYQRAFLSDVTAITTSKRMARKVEAPPTQ